MHIVKKQFFIVFSVLLLVSPYIYQSNRTVAETNEEFNKITSKSTDYSNWFWTEIEVLSSGDDDAYLADMVVDESNNIHITWLDDTDDLIDSGFDRDIFYMNWDYSTETWSSIEVVSTEGSLTSENSQLAIDSHGNLHIVWLDYADLLGAGGSDVDVFYRMRTSAGVWSSYALISDVSENNCQEISIVIDSEDNIYVAWSDPTDVGDLGGTDSDIFYNVYDDSSSMWKGMTLVTDDSSGVSIEPHLVADNMDFIHLVWTDKTDIYGAGIDYDIFYKKFSSSLATWSSTQLVSTESTADSRDGRMGIDSEYSLHVVWHDSTDYEGSSFDMDIFYKYYDSDLSSWKTTEVISVFSDLAAALPDIVIDDYDTIHLTWEDLTDYGGIGTDWDVVYQYKEKNSNQWSQMAIVSLDPDVNSFVPKIFLDNNNHILISWYDDTDYLGSGGDYDIFLRKFVGPPEATILHSFSTDSIEIGNLTIIWEEVPSAESYDVYRDSTFITSVGSLSRLATVNDESYRDSLDTIGDYFYTVVATNRYGDSDLSNIVSIAVFEVEPPEVEQTGLFQTIKLGEILILAGILGAFQLVLVTIVVVLFKTVPSQKEKKGSKKK